MNQAHKLMPTPVEKRKRNERKLLFIIFLYDFIRESVSYIFDMLLSADKGV